MRILLAEHQPEMRSALKLLLEEAAGLEVNLEAENSRELFELVNDENPDIIFFEWELPGTSGEKVIQQIRERYARPVLIALSPKDEAGRIAISEGADGFIRKGSLPQEVIATVIKCLEKKYPVYE